MCIHHIQKSKTTSNLTVGHELHHIVGCIPRCFAYLYHSFNRDIFNPVYLGNDMIADTRSLIKVFLFYIPVDPPFPELFISQNHSVDPNSNGIYSENMNSRS